MAEYINREALLKKAWDADTRIGYVQVVDVGDILDMPAANVAPVVRGWWEAVDSSYWRWTPSGGVSVPHRTYRCGRCWRGTVVKTNYCPNCGAKMDKKEAIYD